MKIRVNYEGKNAKEEHVVLIPARYGVGEHYRTVNQTEAPQLFGENAPEAGTEIEIDIDANDRDDHTLSQEETYRAAQNQQGETPPAPDKYDTSPPKKMGRS